MNLQQRQASSADDADLEVTAELPVLDVAAYEASAAAASEATATHVPVTVAPPEREQLNETDNWHIPAPPVRVTKAKVSEPPNAVIDENRARLEVNLQALSASLRDVEERLTRKDERLVETELALEEALSQRNAHEAHAQALADQVARSETDAQAAQQRIAELQKALHDQQVADEGRQARDAQVQAQLASRNSEIQAQIAASSREFESKFAGHADVVAQAQRELEATRERAHGYFEALQTNESRRSVFEDLITKLGDDVEQRDGRIATLEADLGQHTGHERELESELRERVARIAALDKQVSTLSAALAQRTEQQSDGERSRSSLQQTVNSLNGTLAERNDRVKVLEATVEQQTISAAQLRAELERAASERTQLLAAAASLEAALKAATARGDQQESVARSAQNRIDELEASTPAQRRRVEQLEAEVSAVRAELQSSSSSLQTAGVERSEHMARLAAGDARIAELEARVSGLQDIVHQLQAEANVGAARSKGLESDLVGARSNIERLEGQFRAKTAHAAELEKINDEWRATVEEARRAINDRDGLIERLEQETAASAVLVGHIQKSITRLDNTAEVSHEPAPDGAARLLVRIDGDSEVVHVLGRKTTVGRTPDNDLQIDAKFISRHHAVILSGPSHAIIEDLNSTNGVMVNSRRITRQSLKDGDNVVIGKTQFKFVVRAARATA